MYVCACVMYMCVCDVHVCVCGVQVPVRVSIICECMCACACVCSVNACVWRTCGFVIYMCVSVCGVHVWMITYVSEKERARMNFLRHILHVILFLRILLFIC